MPTYLNSEGMQPLDVLLTHSYHVKGGVIFVTTKSCILLEILLQEILLQETKWNKSNSCVAALVKL